jgi:hypothetical protein
MAYQKIKILDADGNHFTGSPTFDENNQAVVTIAYESDEANTTGVGFRFGFSASGISIVSVDNVFTGAIASGAQSGDGDAQALDFGWASLFGQFPGSETADLATITLEKVGGNNQVHLDFYIGAAGFETLNDNPYVADPLEITEFAIAENSGEGQVIATLDNGDEGASYSLVDNTVYSGGDDNSAPSDPVAPVQQSNTQHVYISDSQLSEDGSQVTVTVAYMADDANTTGVGPRVHFDSSVLSLASIDNVFAGAISSGELDDDADNSDGDASTNQMLNFGWASIFGQFPGSNEATLATITFDIEDGASGATNIGISASSNAAGYTFDGQGFAVQLPEAGPLSIDSATGTVTLNVNPDFESVPVYSFDIVDNSGRTGSASVSIVNADEVSPAFALSDITIEIPEDTAGVIYTANADDSADVSAGVTYSLAGADAAAFAITADGDLTAVAVDYEAKSSYSVTIIADDGVNPVAELPVTVNVTNIDEKAPIFTSSDAASLTENSGANQVVYTAIAGDDASDITTGPISLSLIDDANGEFSIDASGNVTLATNPDYETQSSYSFTVRATDGKGNFTDQTVTLSIIDVEPEKPVFELSPDPVIDENTEFSYTAVASVGSSGVDEALVYSLSDDADGVFVIDAVTGEVSMTVATDYEQGTGYSFTVRATDNVGNFSDKTVTVTINNLDDYAPTFDDSSVVLDPITENTGAGQVIYTAQADDSGDISDGVSYGFDLNPTTSTQPPALEENTQHVYISETTSSEDGSQLTAVVSYTSSSADTTGLGLRIHFDSSVLSLSALTDALGDDVIFTSNQAVADTSDADNNPVTDAFVDAAWASVLGDWPDQNLPTNLMTLTFDVNDSAAVSTVLGVSAIDSPQGFAFDGQALTVPLVKGVATTLGSLTIDPVSGEVVLLDDPDYENTAEYNFSVIATDAAGNQSESQSVNLVINDEQLAITSSSTADAVDENIDAGSVVYNTTVSGAEAQDTISYSLLTNLIIEQGGIEQRFVENVDGSITLQLFVSPSLLANYPSSIENFDLVIGYDDSSITQQSVSVASEAQLQIIEETVVGEIKIAGIFMDQLPNISDNPIVELVFTLNQDITSAEFSVTDVLIGTDHNPLQNSISRYYDSRGFEIDTVTGDVSIIDSPDHESRTDYVFSVMAIDEVRGQSDIQTVTLAINDVDDAAPDVDVVPSEPLSPDTGITVIENSGAGQHILTVTADDSGDITDGVTFSIAGADADSFNVDANTGVVTLIENPDFETQNAYNFTVIATDAAGNSDQQDIQVNIENVDDSAPEITSGATAGNIDENSGENLVIYSATADDSNDISETPLTYSLSGDSDSALSIDASSGEVTLLDNPDFESQSQYSFTVTATDGAGNVSQGQTVTLNINNIDEIAPEITSGVVANNVVENSAAGQHVYTVTATDSADISGGISYSLADDSDGNFSIDADGKVTFTGSADYEQQSSYSFSVIATDAAGNSSGPHEVTMQVDNLDETGPTITSSNAANDISENSGANQVVYTATAEDTDFNGEEVIEFSLDASSDSVFSINAETGEVTLAVDPDFEAQNQYSFTVIATDDSGNQSQSQTVSLSINDVDDFALSGKVYHWATQSMMDDVSISMRHKEGGEHIKTVSSNATGDFVVDELAADEVVVTAHRELQAEDTGRLVTSLDALAALKIGVGDNPNALDDSGINQIGVSAYQFFAADVNKSGKVTSADALEILRMSVRSPLAIEREWMFIDESQDFWDETANDGQGALTVDRLSVSLNYDGAEMTVEQASEANFVGVLLGDVYSNWQSPDSHKMNYSHFVNLENAGKAPMYQFGMSPQEVPFEINSDVTAVAIDENSGASQVVYNTTSNEAGATYALGNAGDSSQFEIGAASGVVVLKDNPDFETQQSYTFEVIATNEDGYVDSQLVTLNVNNLDEVAPTITSGSTADSIDENSGAGQVIYTATATDDADVSDGVSYSLAAGADSALSINAETGEVTLSDNPDYETNSSYSFAVIATDAAGNASQQAVTLDITNIDDTAPVITSSATATPLAENSGAGQSVYTVTADDSVDSSGDLTYSLVDHSAVQSAINIPQVLPNTQHVYVSESTKSSDGTQETVVISYNAEIDSLTGLGLKVHFDSSVLSVDELTDVFAESNLFAYGDAIADDDNADGDASTDMYLSMAWASIFGGWPGELPKDLATVTFNILDQDVDSSTINFVTTSTAAGYSFDGQSHDMAIADGASSLSIDSTTGVVTLNDNPDYEAQSAYSFDVIATDAAGNASEAITVTLDITNLDEVAPVFESSTVATIASDIGANNVVYTAQANDGDDPGAIVYAIDVDEVNYYSEGVFEQNFIVEQDGSITMQLALTQDVIADIAVDGLSNYDVIIGYNPDEVGDITADQFTETVPSSFGIYNDQNVGELIGVAIYFPATTDDSWQQVFAELNYTHEPGVLSSKFDIYNVLVDEYDYRDPSYFSSARLMLDTGLTIDSATGEVTLASNPNAMVQPEYSFTVTATDPAGNVASQKVTLTVNESEPVDTPEAMITSPDVDIVLESGGSDQVVYTAISNIDGATYSLVDHTDYSVASDDSDNNSDDDQPQIPAETVITVPEVQANTQHVYVSDAQLSEDGSQITATFSYLADNANLSGVGFTANFDSSVLTVNEISNLFFGAIASGTQSADDDNDPATDQALSFGWASLFGQFPGSTAVDLATVTFDIAEGAPGMTGLNLVKTSAAAGYTFDGQSQDLVILANSASDNTTGSGESQAPAESVIIVPEVQANTQHVYVSESTKSEDGTQVTITYSYLVDESAKNLSGVGFTVNFDSTVLSVNGISDVYVGAIASGTQSADDQYDDNDSATDQALIFGWASLFGQFPGSASVDLATVTFDIAEGATGSTGLNLVKTSNAAGFDFEGLSHNVVISTEVVEDNSDSSDSDTGSDTGSAITGPQLSIDSVTGDVTLAGEADYHVIPNYYFTVTADNGTESASQDVDLLVADYLVSQEQSSYQGTAGADVFALAGGSAQVTSGDGADIFILAPDQDESEQSGMHTITDFESGVDAFDSSAALISAGYNGLSTALDGGVQADKLNLMFDASADVLDLVSSNSASLDNVFGSYFDSASKELTFFADTDSAAGQYELETFKVKVEGDAPEEEDFMPTFNAFIA